MRTKRFFRILCIGMACFTASLGAKEKNKKENNPLIYPNIMDTSLTVNMAASIGSNNTTFHNYFSKDPFNKIKSYYAKIGKELIGWPSLNNTKLSDGSSYNEVYYVLDSAKTLAESKIWVKVQNPYIKKTTIGVVKQDKQSVKQITDPEITLIILNVATGKENCTDCGN